MSTKRGSNVTVSPAGESQHELLDDLQSIREVLGDDVSAVGDKDEQFRPDNDMFDALRVLVDEQIERILGAQVTPANRLDDIEISADTGDLDPDRDIDKPDHDG